MPGKGTKKAPKKGQAATAVPRRSSSIKRQLEAHAGLSGWGEAAAKNNSTMMNVGVFQRKAAAAAEQSAALKAKAQFNTLQRVLPIIRREAEKDDLKDLWITSGRCTCDLLSERGGPMPDCTCFPEGLPVEQWPEPPAPKPRAGKVMRECKDSDVMHLHERTGAPCKFVHKDEPEFEMLRPEQLRGAKRSPKKTKGAKPKSKESTKSKGGWRSWLSFF